MIKNILYSLFLHSIFLLLVYANFNLKNIKDNRANEISVSLISMSGNEDAKPNNKPSDSAPSDKQKEETPPKEDSSKEAESEKESSKNKVASLPKRVAKPKPTKSIAKAVTKDNAQPVKEVQKPEEKQDESGKEKLDDTSNQNLEDKKNDVPRKDQDIGAEKKSEDKQDSDNKDNVSKNSKANQAQNLENIDLSAREKFNIQSQLKRCYSRAVSETNYHNKEKVMLQVSINEDGVINSDIDDVIDMKRYNDPKDVAYKIAIDNARRAIELCSPIRNLPTDKYEIWKEVVLEFGEEN